MEAAGRYVALSEGEQKRYSELLSLCQAEGGLAAGSGRMAELFQASQLPPDTLHQITELCGAKHLGFFGPAQFFIALKLIAAAQAGLPVRLESTKCELPLACFFSMKSDGSPSQNIDTQKANHALGERGSPLSLSEGENKSDAKTSVSSPQKFSSSCTSSPQYGQKKPQRSPDHSGAAAYETRHPALLQQDGQLPLNYGSQPAPLQSSVSRSLFTEREAQDTSDSYTEDPWRITEEQREYYTNQFKTLQPDLNSFISGSVAKHFFTRSKLPIPELSHIWDLSDVDCDGSLTLAEFCAAFHLIVARKNGYDLPDILPKNLLSEIIPSASLKSTTDGIYEAYCGSNSVCLVRKELETVCEDPAISEPLILFDVETSNTEPKPTIEVPHSENALEEDSVSDLKVSEEKSLTQPVSSEPKKFPSFKTVDSTNMSHGNQRLLCFSSEPLKRAVKSSMRLMTSTLQIHEPMRGAVGDFHWAGIHALAAFTRDIDCFRLLQIYFEVRDLRILFELPQKIGNSYYRLGIFPESYTPKTRPRSRSYSSTSIGETMKKVEEPPTPPPRPQKTHSRASSLDLNRIIQQHSPAPRAGWIQPPPALPPRPCASQIPFQINNTEQKIPIQKNKTSFSEFKPSEQSERAADIDLHPQANKILPQTEESSPAKKEIVLSQPPSKPLRRKFHPESQLLENHDLSSASSVTSSAASLKSHPAVQKQPSKQKKAIQTAIRKNKEANAVLARLNSELQQQLKEVHQERIALENQLEQLRPLTVL
ncbi:ralBP1-associated Eps domain-containing protein 2 [Gastrophryne carolinensis]